MHVACIYVVIMCDISSVHVVFKRVTFLAQMWCTLHSCVHLVFIRVTFLACMLRSYVWHFWHARCILMCDNSSSNMGHVAFTLHSHCIHPRWVHMCDISSPNMGHVALTCVPLCIHMWDMTLWDMWDMTHWLAIWPFHTSNGGANPLPTSTICLSREGDIWLATVWIKKRKGRNKKNTGPTLLMCLLAEAIWLALIVYIRHCSWTRSLRPGKKIFVVHICMRHIVDMGVGWLIDTLYLPLLICPIIASWKINFVLCADMRCDIVVRVEWFSFFLSFFLSWLLDSLLPLSSL